MDINYTKKSVQSILERFYRFQSLKEKGNVDAIITMIDIIEAIKKCEFTERQKQVFFYHFLREYTLEEVAEKLQITKQSVQEHKERTVTKVYKALVGGKP
jgi:RNA polymerase sigma factor (sigma-70 family)